MTRSHGVRRRRRPSPLPARILRWTPWLYGPFFVLTAVLLVSALATGAHPRTVLAYTFQAILWAALLTLTRTELQRDGQGRHHRP
ncbi:hypothetical protein QQY24_29200 [Streptomyces sp. TG1A-8]|uniref:hypothetical protein n=1 Tax=Streptomyces sp. TG1A-8 TaxID=3051385 RepID=UPI00265C3CBE|nr:hypothetical protein [Streptomyces sp. TG1A-8]MDO0929291.1 hypothetical protein [Streptomyces sp. TG1A-8]